MIVLFAKKKTLVSLPADLMERGKRIARSHSVSFSEYVERLLSTDLAERARRGRVPKGTEREP